MLINSGPQISDHPLTQPANQKEAKRRRRTKHKRQNQAQNKIGRQPLVDRQGVTAGNCRCSRTKATVDDQSPNLRQQQGQTRCRKQHDDKTSQRAWVGQDEGH